MKVLVKTLVLLGLCACAASTDTSKPVLPEIPFPLVRIKDDPFQKLSFYSHALLATWQQPVEVYVGRTRDGELYRRVKFRYTGSTWIFFDRAIFLFDGKDTLEFSLQRFERDTHIGEDVSEWYDQELSTEKADEFLRRLRSARLVQLRLTGKYSQEYAIARPIQQALILMLGFSGRVEPVALLDWSVSPGSTATVALSLSVRNESEQSISGWFGRLRLFAAGQPKVIQIRCTDCRLAGQQQGNFSFDIPRTAAPPSVSHVDLFDASPLGNPAHNKAESAGQP